QKEVNKSEYKSNLKDSIDKERLAILQARKEAINFAKDLKGSLAESLNNAKKFTEQAKQSTESFKQALLDSRRATQDAKTGLEQQKQALIDSKVAIDNQRVATEKERTAAAAIRKEIAQLTLEKRKNSQQTVAASGSYREAQQRLTALGRSIREAKGGFASTSPAIKAQIAEYNNLNNALKKFDAQMGNHQRNVGNYPNTMGALSAISPQISQLASKGGGLLGLALGLKNAYDATSAFDNGLKNVQ